jgi:hypothetical protein
MYLSSKRITRTLRTAAGNGAHKACSHMRRVMTNNIGDGLLLDIRGIGLADPAPTGLDLALERILSSNSGCNFNSFNSSI